MGVFGVKPGGLEMDLGKAYHLADQNGEGGRFFDLFFYYFLGGGPLFVGGGGFLVSLGSFVGGGCLHFCPEGSQKLGCFRTFRLWVSPSTALHLAEPVECSWMCALGWGGFREFKHF